MKRTIEIEDTLDELQATIRAGVEEILKDYALEHPFRSYSDHEPDREDPPEICDLDYDGAIHELVDGTVPIYTNEIRDLFYLYGEDFEAAFEDAGIGSKDDNWPMGWKPAAIYCYLEQYLVDWYETDGAELWGNIRDELRDATDGRR